MFHIDVTIEDCRIIATELDRSKITDIAHPMSVRFIDVPTSQTIERILSLESVTAIVAYGLSGQDGDDYVVTYHQADSALPDDVPQICRPIP